MIFPTLNVKIERWKFNSEYGIYVSTLGHFKDRQKRNLSIRINNGGYCSIRTEKGCILAHRLVLFTWRPIPNREVMTVDHINHNKRDNTLQNLEWVTSEENLNRAKRDLLIEKESEKESKKDRLKINGMIMTYDSAINFMTYNDKVNIDKIALKKYLKQFLSNAHIKKGQRVHRFGYCFEKVT